MKTMIEKSERQLDAWGEKLEKISITYPVDLITGIFFFLFSLVLLLMIPQQVIISEKDLVNGRAFPNLLTYLMMAMSLLLVGKEVIKLLHKQPMTTKTTNLLVEVKALIIALILIGTYLLAKVTDLFVVGAVFCSLAFLIYFRCKKKSYYAITIGMAVAIWAVFRFVLGVSF